MTTIIWRYCAPQNINCQAPAINFEATQPCKLFQWRYCDHFEGKCLHNQDLCNDSLSLILVFLETFVNDSFCELLLTKILSMFSLKLWRQWDEGKLPNIVQNYPAAAVLCFCWNSTALEFQAHTHSRQAKIKNVKWKKKERLQIFCTRSSVQTELRSKAVTTTQYWRSEKCLMKRYCSSLGDKNLAETYFARKKC